MSPRSVLVFPAPTPNLRALQQATNEVAYLVPTATGMAKSIMDATAPVRALLKDSGYHDYEQQRQGVRRRERATLVDDQGATQLAVSLYRPEAKSGDPRIWFERLARFADAGDTLALFLHEDALHVLNLSRVHLDNSLSFASQLIQTIRSDRNAIAHELLVKLQQIAVRGWI